MKPSKAAAAKIVGELMEAGREMKLPAHVVVTAEQIIREAIDEVCGPLVEALEWINSLNGRVSCENSVACDSYEISRDALAKFRKERG